jgi:hypothetical protein
MIREWHDYRDLNEETQLSPIEDEEIEMVPVFGPDRGGFGSRLGLGGYRAPDEEIVPEEEMP